MDFLTSTYILATASTCIYAAYTDIRWQSINHISWIILAILGILFGWGNFSSSYLIIVAIPLGIYAINRVFHHSIGTGDLLFIGAGSLHLTPHFWGFFYMISGVLGLFLWSYYRIRFPHIKNIRIPLVPALGLGLQWCILSQQG
ncbi:MAG: prepilin peptidase [Alphaproteobacteria bacterium]|nr:MAG: prepilin peptidase [Alphaproteobacteria bacterium]